MLWKFFHLKGGVIKCSWKRKKRVHCNVRWIFKFNCSFKNNLWSDSTIHKILVQFKKVQITKKKILRKIVYLRNRCNFTLSIWFFGVCFSQIFLLGRKSFFLCLEHHQHKVRSEMNCNNFMFLSFSKRIFSCKIFKFSVLRYRLDHLTCTLKILPNDTQSVNIMKNS